MFVTPMTQFFSLPDYTFTDVVLPQWVMPDYDRSSDWNLMNRSSGPYMGTPRPVQVAPVCPKLDPPSPAEELEGLSSQAPLLDYFRHEAKLQICTDELTRRMYIR